MATSTHRFTMKPTKTKAEVRAELDAEIARYLSSGGAVNNIPTGTSGQLDNRNLFAQATQFEPKQTRTPLSEVVKELDARKSSKNSRAGKLSRRPTKKLITDDFGEPIRWVWQE